MVKDRIPPQNLEAEAAVLGSMMIDTEAIPRGIEKLTAACFYHPPHRKVFETITYLFENSRAVDLVTLTEKLGSDGLLESVGGASYLAELAHSVPTSANIDYYINIVHDKFILRSLIQAATQIVGDGYTSSQEAGELLDRAERLMFEIAGKRFGGEAQALKEIVKNCIEMIDRLYQRKENITGVPTGFHEFDVQTAGLQKSDLIIVAARPSMGKSAFVTNICEHVGILERVPTAIFSLEMSKEQLTQRMLCSQARVNAHKVRTGFLAQSDWPKLTEAAAKLSKAEIFIDDTPGISALELRAKARRLKSQHDIQLVVVDYLQLMRGDSDSENRQQEISSISRSLKALARELKVPVIAVSQLSRAVESRTDRRPQLSDLRESGAIEQDSDMVILLMREEYYKPTEENRGMAEVIIAKQRNGPVGTIKLTFVKEFTRFENMELAHRAVAGASV
ncbi:MAG: replicative DNA helicase [Candidatus Omnitrophica bacterium]|nr:replicative DNA helicase [Candidatus Omnitrophota bacterium]